MHTYRAHKTIHLKMCMSPFLKVSPFNYKLIRWLHAMSHLQSVKRAKHIYIHLMTKFVCLENGICG